MAAAASGGGVKSKLLDVQILACHQHPPMAEKKGLLRLLELRIIDRSKCGTAKFGDRQTQAEGLFLGIFESSTFLPLLLDESCLPGSYGCSADRAL